MPTLNWIGKDAVVKHHKDVLFRLLEPAPELSCGGRQGRRNAGLARPLTPYALTV
jgi:hypothetical protein